MKNDLTSLEVIGIAIRSEEDAFAFYKKIADIVKNDLVKNKFEELAKEEGRHRTILINLYHKLTGENFHPVKIPGNPETAEKGLPVTISDLEDSLMFAISREQEAGRFYANAATLSTDHTAKRTLEYLADIERGHEQMIKKELEAFRRDRDFYANNPEIQLLG